MTREEIIEHYADVVKAVFKAEEKVFQLYKKRLHDAREASSEEKYGLYKEYTSAIAEELISSYPEEELQKLYNEHY